jgi:predicted DNA-binding transcriptional regulator YafY
VKGHSYEDLGSKSHVFHQIELAIGDGLRISFDYTKADTCKAYRDVEPYKLINQKGIWYLAAVDAGKLKTFSFSRLDRLLVSAQSFVPDPAVHQRLVEEDGIWLSEQRLEIVLKVAGEVAGYFKRRKLIANQVIEKELADGGLIVSARVGHANQVLPVVRYWIPHLKIISPESLQTELDHGLAAYLAR